MALIKLTIIPFGDEYYSDLLKDVGTFSVQINPENFAHGHSTEYSPIDSSDTAGTPTAYSKINPETVSFSFYLDGTGVLGAASIGSVSSAIENFKRVAYKYNGNINSPNYLMLIWGDFLFKCRLISLDVDYTLFDTFGIPLRAMLKPSFQQFLSIGDLAKQAAKNSPDMTHLRMALVGDTLPLMCQRIYGDSDYYMMVANYNGLTQFRDLQPGQKIVFPPL